MAEEKHKLIYADDLLSDLREDESINGANLRRVIQHINAAPAVDTVVHGRLIRRVVDQEHPYYWSYDCSKCGCHCDDWSRYCPYCGTKFDGGNEDA